MLNRLRLLPCLIAVAGTVATNAFASPEVTLYRDKYGVPSIAAKTLPEAAYGLGYAMAQDDALVMERNFMRARGRLAEVDGQSAVWGDATVQALGLEAEAEANARTASGESALLVNDFCLGVNRGLAEQRGKLPAWIKPCTPVDVAALAELINCVFPLYDSGLYQSPIGSNEFGLAPKHSADGHAIISIDPHLPWAAPFLWYEFAIYTPEVSFRGVTMPGLPLGVMGHTDKVAWAMTNNNPHVAALYTVKTDPTNPHRYSFHGQWRDFREVILKLHVRNGSKLVDMPIPVQMTDWGPMVPGQTLAAHLAFPKPGDTVKQVLAMLRASNATQFRNALRLQGESMWNFVYGDTHGHIGYQYNAYLAKRDPSFNWDEPAPGDDPKTAWGALFSIDELPHAEDPASGILVNCNSAPWLTTLGSEVSANWPAYVSSYAYTSRYNRLAALLKDTPPVTPAQAKQIATDTQVIFALPTLVAIKAAFANNSTPVTPDATTALKVLSGWNGRADIDSRGCALYWYWLHADDHCAGLAMEAAAGKAWSVGEDQLAIGALQKAAETMTKDHGTLDIPWGKMHVQNRGSLSTPVSGFNFGSMASVVPNDGAFANGVLHCWVGSSFRMIVDLDPKGVKSWSILPFGESQDPANPHYADQSAMFGRGEYKENHYGLQGAKADAVSSVKLHLDK